MLTLVVISLTKEIIHRIQLRGKEKYIITSLHLKGSIMFFTALNKNNIYQLNLDDIIENKTPKFFKIRISNNSQSYIQIKQMQFSFQKIMGLCSDGLVQIQFKVRIWDMNSRTLVFLLQDKHEIEWIYQNIEKDLIYVLNRKGKVIMFIQLTIQSAKKFYSGYFETSQQTQLTLQFLSFIEYQNGIYGITKTGKIQNIDLSTNIETTLNLLDNFDLEQSKNQLCIKKVQEFLLISYKNIEQFKNTRFLTISKLKHPHILPISQQLNQNFDNYFPIESKRLIFQNFYFFIEKSKLKMFNMIDQQVIILSDLTSINPDQEIIYNDIKQRPLILVHQENSHQVFKIKFISNRQNHFLVFKFQNEYIEQKKTQTIDKYEIYHCFSLLFLGQNEEINPNMVSLENDKKTIIFITQEDKQKDIFLDKKINAIYNSPMNQGNKILFFSENQELILSNDLSKNQDNYFSKYKFKLNREEMILDLKWEKFQCQKNILAVLTDKRIIFLTQVLYQFQELDIIKTYKNSDEFYQIFWFSENLFICNKNSMHYINLLFDKIKIDFSFDNFQNKNHIVGFTNNRIMLATKKIDLIEIRQRSFNSQQYLLLGYISNTVLDQNFQIKYETLQQLAKQFENIKVKSKVIKILRQLKFLNVAKFLSSQDNQINIEESVRLINLILDFTQFWKIFFKNISEKELECQDTILAQARLYKKQEELIMILEKQVQIFFSLGQFRHLVIAYSIMQQENKIQELKTFLKMKQIELQDYNPLEYIQLNSPEQYSLIQERIKSYKEKLQNKELNFGQKYFEQMYYQFKQEEEKAQEVYFSQKDFENLGQFLGQDNVLIQEQNHENHEIDDFSDNDEKMVILWRFDEGKGDLVEDLSDFQYHANILNPHENQWQTLAEGEPLELEDEWGKRCPPQFSLQIQGNYVESQKKINIQDYKTFSIQCWIFPEGDGEILQMANKNGEQVYMSLQITNNQLVLKTLEADIILGDKEAQSIVLSDWNHITLQKVKNDISLFLNCNLVEERQINLGLKASYLRYGKNFKGQISELRLFQKQFSSNLIRETYKYPLEIVAEKKKQIKVKIKQKSDKSQAGDFKSFAGFFNSNASFGTTTNNLTNQIQEIQQERQLKEKQAQDKPIEQEKQQPEIQKIVEKDFQEPVSDSNKNNFSFDQDKVNFSKQFDTNFSSDFDQKAQQSNPFDSGLTQTPEKNNLTQSQNFNDFNTNLAQFNFDTFRSEPNQQQPTNDFEQTNWGQNDSTKKEDPEQKTPKKDQKEKQDDDQDKDLQLNNGTQSEESQKNQQEFFDNFDQKKETQPQILVEELQNQLQKNIKNVLQLFEEKDYKQCVQMINLSFSLIESILQQDKIDNRISNQMQLCANYRFATELLIGLHAPQNQQNHKKTIYLTLILVHLNIKPNHRIQCIIYAIERNILAQNYSIAYGLYQGLLPNLGKVNLSDKMKINLSNLDKTLPTYPKTNANLMKIQCQSCQDRFYFKGVTNCSQCQKNFKICWQTLQPSNQCLKCHMCNALYSQKIRKNDENCPICKFGKLKTFNI